MKHLFCFAKKCATCKIQNSFHHATCCMSHLFQVFNASSLPRGSVCITRWEVAWRAGKFFMLSSKFRTNHREADFYLHTFPRSNCVMRPFSKWCQAEFKANPVQRKSDLIFTQSRLNVIMAKSSWLAPHPLRSSRRRAFGSLKTLFNPSRRISHHLCCGSLPLAFAGSSSPWEENFIQNVSLSLFTVLWLIPRFGYSQSLDDCDPQVGVLKDIKSNIF